MDMICDFLYRWQTLTGALLGGVFSLSVAFIVAYIGRRRDDLAAAMLVTVNVVETKARYLSIKHVSKDKKISEADYHRWVSEKLVQSRPKLTPTFDAAVARLMPLDAHLASHLSMFQMSHRELEEKLDRLTEDYREVREKGKSSRSVESIDADARVITKDFERAAKFAECAENLINMLILGRRRHWHRIRRKFRPTT